MASWLEASAGRGQRSALGRGRTLRRGKKGKLGRQILMGQVFPRDCAASCGSLGTSDAYVVVELSDGTRKTRHGSHNR